MDANTLIKNHRFLSKTNSDFVQRSIDDPDTIGGHRLLIEKAYLPPAFERLRDNISPWPFIIGMNISDEFDQICKKIGPLLYKALVLLKKNTPEMFAHLYGIDDEFLEYIDFSEDVGRFMIGRYDAVISRTSPKLVEYNAGSNIGGWHLYNMTREFKEIVGGDTENIIVTPILEEFLLYLERIGREINTHSNEKVKVLCELEGKGEAEEFLSSLPLFEEAMACRGINIEWFFDENFKDIVVTDERVYIGNTPIDVIITPMFSPNAQLEAVKKLTHLHFRKKVVFPDNIVFLAIGRKLNFATLHYLLNNNMLSESDASMVVKYVPRTFFLDVSLGQMVDKSSVEQLMNDKDTFVVKRDGLFGGEQVYVGPYLTETAWMNLLKLAQTTPGWLAQKYHPSDKYLAPLEQTEVSAHEYVFGFFDFGLQYGGCVGRVAPTERCKGVVNAAMGARHTAVLEVERKHLVI